MTALSLLNTIYLAGILIAFGMFAFSLLAVSVMTNLSERKATHTSKERGQDLPANVRVMSTGWRSARSTAA